MRIKSVDSGGRLKGKISARKISDPDTKERMRFPHLNTGHPPTYTTGRMEPARVQSMAVQLGKFIPHQKRGSESDKPKTRCHDGAMALVKSFKLCKTGEQ